MKNNTNKPTIYFDLDGTLYDLYNQPRWLERITVDYDATAYAADALLVDHADFSDTLNALVAKGYRVGVVSWCAGDNPPKWYDGAVRSVKRAWVKKFIPQATEVHIVKYGTPKSRVVSDRDGMLIDDNTEVLASWKGRKVHASKMMETLKGLANA